MTIDHKIIVQTLIGCGFSVVLMPSSEKFKSFRKIVFFIIFGEKHETLQKLLIRLLKDFFRNARLKNREKSFD